MSMLVQIWGVDTSGEAQRPLPWFNAQSFLSSTWPCAFPSVYASLYFMSCSSLPSSSPDLWPFLQLFLYAHFSMFFLVSISSFLPSFFPSSRALTFASSRSSSITLHSRLLHIMADDVTVVGLQKWPSSGMVLRVGILMSRHGSRITSEASS